MHSGGRGAFPSRDDFISYIEIYERALAADIDRGVRVHRITCQENRWVAETSAGLMVERDPVIATWPDNVPVIPDWSGMKTFPGPIIHAADFGRVEDCVSF